MVLKNEVEIDDFVGDLIKLFSNNREVFVNAGIIRGEDYRERPLFWGLRCARYNKILKIES